jgi:hypothetical protein
MLHTVRLIAWPFLLPLVRSNKGKENAQMSVPRSNRSEGPVEAAPSTADVHIVNHHSIVLFHLNTPKASAWVEENVAVEAQYFGAALVVEPRLCCRPHRRHARGRTGGAVMTTRQASELRIVLQHMAITQAMFRDAVARFERLAAEAGHPVVLVAADDFTIYETGASREDLDFIVERYKRGDETDPLDTLTPDQLRDILALDTEEQWTPETIEQVAWVLVQYGVDKGGR